MTYLHEVPAPAPARARGTVAIDALLGGGEAPGAPRPDEPERVTLDHVFRRRPATPHHVRSPRLTPRSPYLRWLDAQSARRPA